MKKMMIILALFFAATYATEAHRHYSGPFSISLQTFYDELSPYGDWINTPEYGFVWRPYTDPSENFRPYATAGDWAYTDLGWTWVSNYRWGWAPFHYGRWNYDDYMGWYWIPGYEWAPAWVTWGSSGDNWAWAPMGPEIYVNVNVAWHPPVSWWTFVPFGHFCTSGWYSYAYCPTVRVTNITYITNVYYDRGRRHHGGNWYHGPRVGDVEKHLGTRISRMEVADAERPGRDGVRDRTVRVYRPEVTRNAESARPRSYSEQVRPGARVTGNDPAPRTDPGTVRRDPPVRVDPRRLPPAREFSRTPEPAVRPDRQALPRENTGRTSRSNEPKPPQVAPFSRPSEPVARVAPRERHENVQPARESRQQAQPARESKPRTTPSEKRDQDERGSRRR